jgi:tetratricopeptide (TPR) repeat protein
LRSDDRALARLAESVADGAPIDWDAAERGVVAREQRLVRHLRLVDRISTVYRTLPFDSADGEATDIPEPTGERWGRLIILEPIGAGTSCEVFRAWDTNLHRDVALKLLHDDGVSGGAKQRVLDEARRLAKVEHPHVVPVYGAEEHDGRVGLWMQWVRGESLDRQLEARGRFDAAEAAQIGQAVCAAVGAVHDAGLLHRDVKAQNVMRDGGGRVVLMDFGTGEPRRASGGSNRLVGTPLYLAPEIFAGLQASVRSDLYSIGVLLFHLVTGRFPVSGDSMESLAAAHERRDPPRLQQLRPDLPARFVAVVENALEPEPSRRFATATEMEVALREALPERRETPHREAVTRVETSRWSFAAVGAALVAVILALIVWVRQPPTTTAPISAKTIAVLPMTSVDGSATQQLTQGLTYELMATLGQIETLRVQASPQAEAANGADAILHTTVAMSAPSDGTEPRINVQARLIAAGTNATIWSRSFEETVSETSAIEAAIARDIASGVNAVVTSAVLERLSRPRQTNQDAETAFLEGRAYIDGYSSAYTKRALDAFTRAIEADPNHAAAHAGAARALFTLGFANVMSQPEARAKAQAAADKAIDLDAMLPDAHVALADIAFYYDWNWARAESEYLRSLALNPSYSYGRTQYAQFLAAARRTGEAVEQSALTIALEPATARPYRVHAINLYYHRELPAAAAAIQKALEFEQNHAGSWVISGRIAEAEGRLQAALEHTNRAIDLSQDGVPALLRIQQMRLLALTGHPAEARAGLEQLRRESNIVLWNPVFDAYISLALGDHDQALEQLEKAVQQREPSLLYIAVDPRLDPIRNHQRFTKIVKSLGLD